jgi:hypothetical protein
VLGRHQVSYHQCPACGFLGTERPHWLAEAYGEAIADADTGLVARNLAFARIMTVVFALAAPKGTGGDHFVDLAGGYGLFTRLMRDAGFDVRWSDAYCRNLLARGCAVDDHPAGRCRALTMFEALEHLDDPVAILGQLFERHRCRTLFASTEVFSGPPPPPDWPYYSFATGQHISFYTPAALAALAGRLGVAYRRLGPLHVLAPPAALPPSWLRPLVGRAAHLIAPLIRRWRGALTEADRRRLLASQQGRP